MIQIKGDHVEVTGECSTTFFTREGQVKIKQATVRVPLGDMLKAFDNEHPQFVDTILKYRLQRDALAEALREIKGALETQPDCLQLVMAVATEALAKLEGDAE